MSGLKRLRRFAVRITGLFRKKQQERELDEELGAHFEMHVEDNLRRGMTETEARREATLKFGSVESAKESMREASTVAVLETTWQDVRYAVRGLRRSPGFATTAILSLAIGIGASVAIFTLVDNLLLRPLPYHDPDRLMMVWEKNQHLHGTDRSLVSPSNYRDWKERNTVFESMAGFFDRTASFADKERVEELEVQYLTADLLPMIGAQPWRGRLFTAAEDLGNGPAEEGGQGPVERANGSIVVLISDEMWQNWFAGDEGVIGRQVQLRGRPATIIGVMPPGFFLRNRHTDLWAPAGFEPARDYRNTAGRFMMTVTRLKPGVTREIAQAQMSIIARQLETDYPKFNPGWTVHVEPLRESLVSEVKTSLLVLLASVALFLAVACANVASLMLARYTQRSREIAVRVAIGAGRGRVIRQLLTESVILGLAGGAIGVVLARLIIAGMLTLAPLELSRNISVGIDYRIVMFAIVVSALTGILFGLAPSLVAARTNVIARLRDDSRASVGSAGRLRTGLVAAEVALSVMLLIGAGLLFRSLVGLQAVDPGINPAQLLTFRVQLPNGRYTETNDRIQFFTRALDRIAALPGVESASAVSALPFDDRPSETDVAIAGRPAVKPGEAPIATVRVVMPGYFRTVGIPIKKGRDFTPADNTPDSLHRFVVNDAFVQKYMTGEEPLGQQLSVHMYPKNPLGEIIGVVGNVKEGALDRDPTPTVYWIYARLTFAMSFVIRTHGDPLSLVEPARQIIHNIDPAQPIAQVRTMDAALRETFARQRFSALLLSGFSLASLLLAAVGIYGVIAYSVTERTREFGVRVALGAEPGQILTLVLSSGTKVILLGALAGMVGALMLAGLLQGLLFGVTSYDATTFATVPIVLIAVALVAAYLPARRASRLSPIAALRAE